MFRANLDIVTTTMGTNRFVYCPSVVLRTISQPFHHRETSSESLSMKVLADMIVLCLHIRIYLYMSNPVYELISYLLQCIATFLEGFGLLTYIIQKTLVVDDLLSFQNNTEIASTYSKASSPSVLAAIAAQELQQRGPVIVMHTRPDWVCPPEYVEISPFHKISRRALFFYLIGCFEAYNPALGFPASNFSYGGL